MGRWQRDLEHVQVCNFVASVARLLERAALAPLVPQAGGALKPTLLALQGGVQLADRDAPRGRRRSRSCGSGCGR